MKKQRHPVLCASFAVVISVPAVARATTPVTVNFSGVIDQTTDPNGKLAAVGIGWESPFQGYVTYDSSAAYLYDLNLGNGVYNAYYPAILAFHFTVTTSSGSYEFGFDDSAIPSGALISEFIYPSFDQFEVGVSGNGFTPETPIAPTTPAGYTQNWTVELYLNESPATALTTTASLPPSLNLSNWGYTRSVIFSSFAQQGANSVTDYTLQGGVTAPPPVPAPALPGPYPLLAGGLLALLGTLRPAKRPSTPPA